MRQAVYAALQATGVSTVEIADKELLRRFASGRDESAFEALVQRHGPLVQGVCRRILGDAHDAEDAFQAVFLVLARKSKTIRKPELLANWLYGVACRIARKARIRTIRKESRERRAGTMPVAGKMPVTGQLLELEWQELKAVLDDELQKLPEKYRAPLILCYLQGQTNVQAAEQLGWPTGSISERLARAREILRTRLNRRGLTLSAGLLALLLSEKAASAAVSPLLVQSTVRVGVSSASKATTGTISKTVLKLAGDAGAPRLIGYLKTLSVALIIALVIATSWPHLTHASELSLRFVLNSIGWTDSNSIPGVLSPTAVTGTPGAASAGGACHSGSQAQPNP
jgi:RNA polymerase sigma factor (sigma-70 family)